MAYGVDPAAGPAHGKCSTRSRIVRSHEQVQVVLLADHVGCVLQLQVAAAQREESVVNQPAIDLLRRLPGVTDANYRALMNGVASLSELAELSCERLEQLMGGARAAQALYNFLHAPCPLAGLGPATLATAV